VTGASASGGLTTGGAQLAAFITCGTKTLGGVTAPSRTTWSSAVAFTHVTTAPTETTSCDGENPAVVMVTVASLACIGSSGRPPAAGATRSADVFPTAAQKSTKLASNARFTARPTANHRTFSAPRPGWQDICLKWDAMAPGQPPKS
jgi:hypothetical protein